MSSFSRRGHDGEVFTVKLDGGIEMQYLSRGEKVALGVLHVEGKGSEVSVSEALFDLKSLCG